MGDELYELRTQLADLLDAHPMSEWQPDLLRAAIALLAVAGVNQSPQRAALQIIRGDASSSEHITP